jgi:CHAT domain-containing protein
LGAAKAGSGVYGLRRSLFQAGAAHVTMSLWNVPDEETSQLMQRYYTHMLAGQRPSEALRHAMLGQRDARQQAAGPGHQHPFYWGAFIVAGAD